LSDTSHSLSHNIWGDLTIKEVLCHSVVLLTLVGVQGYLVTTVLLRALLRELRSRIHFQSRGTSCLSLWGPLQWGGGMSLPHRKGVPDHLSQMELFWTVPQIVRNKDQWRPTSIAIAIKDTDKVNHLNKAIFTSAEGCAGAEAMQAHGVGNWLQFYP
jgi:hypothetical protein